MIRVPRCDVVFRSVSIRPFGFIFGEAESLLKAEGSTENAVAWDSRSDSWQTVPGVDMLISGIYCGGFSSLNVWRALNRGDLKKANRKTKSGKAYALAREYVYQYGVDIWIIEQVPEFATCDNDDPTTSGCQDAIRDLATLGRVCDWHSERSLTVSSGG